MPNTTIGADAALARLVAAVEAETDPGWDCSSYHPALWSALDVARAALASEAQPDPRTPANMRVNGGALILALNVLRRAGKNEVADELEKTAAPAAQEDALDAARWRMLPAFFHEYQIDALKLFHDIDAAIRARGAQGESK